MAGTSQAFMCFGLLMLIALSSGTNCHRSFGNEEPNNLQFDSFLLAQKRSPCRTRRPACRRLALAASRATTAGSHA